jgi:hypothetical protein
MQRFVTSRTFFIFQRVGKFNGYTGKYNEYLTKKDGIILLNIC